jgi:hypothetical protein
VSSDGSRLTKSARGKRLVGVGRLNTAKLQTEIQFQEPHHKTVARLQPLQLLLLQALLWNPAPGISFSAELKTTSLLEILHSFFCILRIGMPPTSTAALL